MIKESDTPTQPTHFVQVAKTVRLTIGVFGDGEESELISEAVDFANEAFMICVKSLHPAFCDRDEGDYDTDGWDPEWKFDEGHPNAIVEND